VRSVGKRRQYFGLVLGQEFHYRPGIPGAPHYELVTCRLDPKPDLSGPAQYH
jgi:hypothetical protein